MINLQVRYFSKYMSKFEYYMWYSLEKNIDRFLFLSIFILYHTSNQSHERSPEITPICFFIKSSMNGAIVDSGLKIVKARNATSTFSELF